MTPLQQSIAELEALKGDMNAVAADDLDIDMFKDAAADFICEHLHALKRLAEMQEVSGFATALSAAQTPLDPSIVKPTNPEPTAAEVERVKQAILEKHRTCVSWYEIARAAIAAMREGK